MESIDLNLHTDVLIGNIQICVLDCNNNNNGKKRKRDIGTPVNLSIDLNNYDRCVEFVHEYF